MIIDSKLFKEVASKGVSQKTWDSWNETQRADYLKRVPNSKYANPDNTLPTTIKSNKKSCNKLSKEMIDTLNKCVTGSWKENKDGSIDVNGNIDLYNLENSEEFERNFLDKSGKLKFKFGKVSGNFILHNFDSIKSLEGCPKEVGGKFQCYYCYQLESLEGAPEKVDGDFICDDCYGLKTLKGSPKFIKRSFYCKDCRKLESLKGAPQYVGGSFICDGCSNLESLQGAPKEVGCSFLCNCCSKLQTLDGAPEIVKGNVQCCHCRSLFSLRGSPKKVGDDFDCRGCESLYSVKYGPEEIEGDLYCSECGRNGTETFPLYEIKKYCNVKGNIYNKPDYSYYND